jgi:uncharacterized protein
MRLARGSASTNRAELRTRVLIAGVSARAPAESAAWAGFDVTAVDAFADLDQHPAVRAVAVAHFSAGAAARAARDIACDAVAYLSSFENHPDAVEALASGRMLWGNPPPVLRRVRDPKLLSDILRMRGHAVPEVRVDARDGNDRDGCWLVKRAASGGGRGVQIWSADEIVPAGCYLQEFVDGASGSIAFVSAGGRAVPIGLTRQLVGDPAFGADPWWYCGSIFGSGLFADAAARAACALASTVAREFDLVGVNGIDFVVRDDVPYAIEVNPRWCASMELVERGCRLSIFDAHAAACANGALPAFDWEHACRGIGAVGKAIVFADRDLDAGDTRNWLRDADVRDVPRPGQTIRARHPICTVFAHGRDADECYARLVERSATVQRQML